MKFEIFNKSQWVFSCKQHKKKNKNEETLLDDQSFLKTLDNINRNSVYYKINWDDYIKYNSEYNLIKYETITVGGKYLDITEFIKNNEQKPCLDDDDRITYETKPVSIIQSLDKCSKDFKINNIELLKILNRKLKLPYLNIQKDKESKIIIEGDLKKFLDNDVKVFSKQANGFRCIAEDLIRINVKNIDNYLPENNESKQMSNIVEQSIAEQDQNTQKDIINCKDFDLAELRQEVENGNRNDCREILKQKEAENQKSIQTNNERDELNTQLDDLIEFYNNNNLAELILQNFNSIDKKITNLENKLANYKKVDLINSELLSIKYEIDAYKIIFSLFESYENICETYSVINLTNSSEYKDKCTKIQKLKTEDNQDFETRSIYVLERKKLLEKILTKFTELESSVELKIKEINEFDRLVLEENKKKDQLLSKIDSVKTPIETLITKINSKLNILKNQNNKFEKTEIFYEHKDLTSDFENEKNTIKQILNNIQNNYKSYDGKDKNSILNLIDELEEEINSIDNLIFKYENEYQTYKKNLNIRDEYLIEQKKLEEEKAKQEAEKEKKEAENKKRLKEEAKKAQEEKKINETITNIKKLEKDINIALKGLKTYIEDEITNLNTYIDNFIATNDDVIDFNAINSNIQKNEKLINKFIQEYGDAISSLPSDFDHQRFDFSSIEDLKFNKKYFNRELEGLQEKISNKLDTKITQAKNLIDSREKQLVEIVSKKKEELILKQQELEIQKAEKQKLEDEKRIAEEENNQKEQLIEEKKQQIQSKDQTILKLQDDSKTLKNSLVIEQENVSNRNLMIYLLITLSLTLAGLLIYFIIRKKPSSKNAEEGYVSKINELEQRLEREIQQSRAQANNQTTVSIKTETPKEIKKVPTQEEIKNEQLRKLYEDYNEAMKNPNLIETFQSNYNAIGLERESKIATGRKVRLRRVNTSFDRAIFWVVEHDRKLLVFGGRMLKVQAPSLLADDGTMARDLLQGIFALQTGPDLKTHKCAIVHKNNQIYEVMMEGILQLPKID